MIESNDPRREHTGNGVATEFAYGVPVTNKTHLTVTLVTIATGDESPLTVDTDYTVNGVGSDDSADWDITYPVSGSPMASTHKLVITPNVPLLQETDFENVGGFLADTHEAAFDKLTVIAQQQQEELNRCVKVSIGSDTDPDDLISDLEDAVASAQALENSTFRTINSQSGNYTVISTDRNKLVDFTGSSASTFTLTAAASLATRFEFVARNSGTAALTIDPNSSETIDGSSTLVLLPGQAALLICNGTSWSTELFYDVKGLVVNAQTGTTYTVLQTDRGKLVTFSNGSSVAVTLPQATGNFGSRWCSHFQNRGAGTVTITPTSSTIDGAASIALKQNQGVIIVSDGANYFTVRGRPHNVDLTSDVTGILPIANMATGTPTGSKFVRDDGTLAIPSSGQDIIILEEQLAQGTDAGAFTSGAWRTRVINTEVADTGNHCSIASNQITLAAGTYRFFIKAPANSVDLHAARLYNITDSAVVKEGSSERATSGGYQFHTCSFIIGRVTIADTKVFEIQHRCQTTDATRGFGGNSNFQTEVYTQAIFWKE